MNVPKSSLKPWLVWLSWLKCHLINPNVTGSIPSQVTCLGQGRVGGAVVLVSGGGMYEATD